MIEESNPNELEGIDLEADEHEFYPDSLELNENVVFSYRPKGLQSLLNLKTYFVTDKRIFSEHRITKKREEVEYKKVYDVLIIQKGLDEKQNKGKIIIEHSNYKTDVPLNKKKEFIMPKVVDPQQAFLTIKKEVERHKKHRK
jgi:hypothetical protein